MKSSYNDIRLLEFELANVMRVISINGICLISNYINEGDLVKLETEFERLLAGNGSKAAYSSCDHPTNRLGRVVRLKAKKLEKEFNLVRGVFLNRDFNMLAQAYFGGKASLIDDIFLTHEKESEVAILPWHFDRQQSLKFYINLLDVDAKNGALEYDIGSHREGHFRANFYTLLGVPVGRIPNDIPNDELRNPVTIKAKAGDLVIFDPDGFHRGGVVSPSEERKVIRGHSHPIPNRGYRPKLFDAHWWLQSPLNLARLLGKRSQRTLNPDVFTKSVNARRD